MGELHIVGDGGLELLVGETGEIYFGNTHRFSYHNDVKKTESVYLPNGWVTLGDIGRVDEEGYLALSDRKDFMIITGGVNVYPKEIEDVLVMHPLVDDAAVFDLPNTEYDEEIKAVIQPTSWPTDETAFIESLTQHRRARLSSIKVPKSLDLARALPREENGKLYKKKLRKTYLTAMEARSGVASPGTIRIVGP